MKKFYRHHRRTGAVLTALVMLLGLFPAWGTAVDSAPASDVTVTFTDSGITSSGSSDGYEISGTDLTITAAGTYAVTGSCAEGSITVDSGTTGVTLVLDNLSLTSASTAPLVCKKKSGTTLYLSGASVLTDNEDAADSNAEGAAVKVKSSASLTVRGTGTLTANGNCKNGIKGASTAAVTLEGGTVNINAVNHGLASDGAVVIQGGVLNIVAENDGMKSSPDADDTESAGTVTISGGEIAIDAVSDGINAAGDITITGGTFSIAAQSDGIQTDSNLIISGGTFDITTLDGYNSTSFDSDTMSCKGLKASASDEDTENAENAILISGGTFVLNTADDAIHSDAYITITGGTFTIDTGDDGAHADTTLTLGVSGGLERDPDITVRHSYEGLEAGTVNILGGRYYVVASDDGINAGGGSGSGDDPGGGGGGDHFRPGGGGPRLMDFEAHGGRRSGGARLMDTGDYSLNISGGRVYVDAEGDGLDSNGTLTLSGGEIVIWGPRSGTANAALDSDGTMLIQGVSVFAAGSGAMIERPSSSSQTYYAAGVNISAGALATVKDSGGTAVFNDTAPGRAVNYVIYSTPDMESASGYSVTAGSGSVSCAASHSWTHTWTSAVTTPATRTASGVITYTCSVCGETERQTLPALSATTEEDGGNTCTVNGTSAEIRLDLGEYGISAGTYRLLAGFYNADGKMLGIASAVLELDSTLCGTASNLTCPESFDTCAAFLLAADESWHPVCPKISLSVEKA